ncbi:MAG: Spy/CpxP family protein refolding chaperone [Hormoscilla sp.]
MLAQKISVLSILLLSLGGASAEVLALANSGPPAQTVAQNFRGPKGHHRGPQMLMEQLNLSQAQMQDLEEIKQKYQEQFERQRQQLHEAQQELSELMAGTASTSQIRNKYRQVSQLRQQMGDLHFESLLEMREVLTPEQRRQFAEQMQRRHRGRGKPMRQEER